MGYQLETTALISKDNYNAFRIRCIMLILEKLNIHAPNSFTANQYRNGAMIAPMQEKKNGHYKNADKVLGMLKKHR